VKISVVGLGAHAVPVCRCCRLQSAVIRSDGPCSKALRFAPGPAAHGVTFTHSLRAFDTEMPHPVQTGRTPCSRHCRKLGRRRASTASTPSSRADFGRCGDGCSVGCAAVVGDSPTSRRRRGERRFRRNGREGLIHRVVDHLSKRGGPDPLARLGPSTCPALAHRFKPSMDLDLLAPRRARFWRIGHGQMLSGLAPVCGNGPSPSGDRPDSAPAHRRIHLNWER